MHFATIFHQQNTFLMLCGALLLHTWIFSFKFIIQNIVLVKISPPQTKVPSKVTDIGT